jgi:predicted kinase
VQLRCAAPVEVARQRLAARIGDISDADAAIARQMAAGQAPWPGAVTIDTSQLGPGPVPAIPAEQPDTVVRQAMEAIRAARVRLASSSARAVPRLNQMRSHVT